MFKTSILVAIPLLLTNILLAQERVSACGESLIDDNITLKQAKKNALAEAKSNALQQAGIEERVTSSRMSISSQADKSFSQKFSEVSNIEIGGIIQDWNITSETKYENTAKIWVEKICINALVKRYDKPKDPSFSFESLGIKEKYESGSNLIFSIKPTQKGFLKVFVIDSADSASMVYPNAYENYQNLVENITVNFPTSSKIQYTLKKNDPKSKTETNHLILVLTKRDIPFIGEVTTDSILKWIAGIDPDQREEKTETFIIL